MTPEQAIELLQKDIDNPGSVAIEDVNEAEGLGIEALKYCLADRLHHIKKEHQKLPGETLD